MLKTFLKIDKNLYRPIDIQINYGDNLEAKNKLKWNYNINFEQLISKLVEDEIQYLKWGANKKYNINNDIRSCNKNKKDIL